MHEIRIPLFLMVIILYNAAIGNADSQLMRYDENGNIIQLAKIPKDYYIRVESIGDDIYLWNQSIAKMVWNGEKLQTIAKTGQAYYLGLCDNDTESNIFYEGTMTGQDMYIGYYDSDLSKKWQYQFPMKRSWIKTIARNNLLATIEIREKEENKFRVNIFDDIGHIIWNAGYSVNDAIFDMLLRFYDEQSVVVATSDTPSKIHLFQFDSKGQLVARDILEYGFLASLETTENSIILLLGRNDSNIYDLLYYNKNLEQLLSIELGIYADYETQLVVDSQDNVFVAGCERSSGFCQEVKLTKINSDGDILWTQKFQAESLGLKKMELDKEENPVIGMDRCDFYDEYGIGCRMLLLKYDSDGNLMWKAESESKDEVEQVFEDLTIDQDNNVIAMIYSDEADDDSNNDDDDDEKGCGC